VTAITDSQHRRLRIAIQGQVQGVGFRPFIYRLAKSLQLTGWVRNSPQGVVIEAEGDSGTLREFVDRIPREKPPLASVVSIDRSWQPAAGYTDFRVAESEQIGQRTALVLPDIATCDDCRHEILDPADRRFRYPFTNCTNCGPRFSIIEALPYDRSATAMKGFTMCEICRTEYDDPLNRRFHAQPNACPACGPRLEYWNSRGSIAAARHGELLAAARTIRDGGIVAVKGIGGFHLMVDARGEEAVRRLRERKGREAKPLAVMVTSLDQAHALCHVSPVEERLLLSPPAPIVLMRSRPTASELQLAPSVAPRNAYLGLFLPYSPLHHLLMHELGFPVVATSGNRTDEPICTDEHEALARLGDIADAFLVHNRPIIRPVDDSVVRISLGQESILRRSRGYAPLPVTLKPSTNPFPPILGAGGQMKSTVAAAVSRNIFMSQHVGDLDADETARAYRETASAMCDLHDVHPVAVACDAHPDYYSTRWAEACDLPVVRVQHHHAHVLACLAEQTDEDVSLHDPVLGIAWDGTGYGSDGTVWGGEFLRVTGPSFERVAHLRPFRLPGGEAAVREPRRSALGVLHEIWGSRLPSCQTLEAFSDAERRVLTRALDAGLNAPMTTSVGRLFDAVASLAGICQYGSFEGQAAMELEFAVGAHETDAIFPFDLWREARAFSVDWEPMIRQILRDLAAGVSLGLIAARFHNTLSSVAVAVARQIGAPAVVLTGGCFQNQYLLERTVRELQTENVRVWWHRRVPPNDGAIALGQVVAAGLRITGKEEETCVLPSRARF
jgi:hydrogenase maturation protein HypF